MEKTTHYQLNKPEVTDPMRLGDFNENADIIDAALANLSTALGGKAEKSAVTAVETALANYKTSNNAALANKADASALAALSAALGSGGSNCRIAWGSYTGTGKYGSNNPIKLDFDFCPVAVIVASDDYESNLGESPILIRGRTTGAPDCGSYGNNGRILLLTWGSKSLSWYCTDGAEYQNNTNGKVYYYVVIGY